MVKYCLAVLTKMRNILWENGMTLIFIVFGNPKIMMILDKNFSFPEAK
jgi:hypothetical protein